MNANGDTAPQNLDKLFRQLKGMAREAKRSIGKRRNRVYAGQPSAKSPRQSCIVCGLLWDVATVVGEPKPPIKTTCESCKKELASGKAAFITAKHHVWITPGAKSNLKAGQVYLLTDDAMEVVIKRFKAQNEKPPE